MKIQLTVFAPFSVKTTMVNSIYNFNQFVVSSLNTHNVSAESYLSFTTHWPTWLRFNYGMAWFLKRD